MKKLDIVLSERTEKIEQVQRDKQSSDERVQIDYKNEMKRLNYWKERELEKINREFAIGIKKTEDEYILKLAQALANDIEADFQIMQERNKYRNVSEEDINKASIAKRILSGMGKELKDDFLEFVPENIKDIIEKENLDRINEKETIVTYIIPNNERCYILTPIKSDKLQKIAEDLENRLTAVLHLGKITEQPNEVLTFICNELNYPREFLMFEINSVHDINYLAKQLANKLNNKHIQPGEFAKHNLEHKAIVLDYAVFKTFLDSESEKEFSKKSAPIRIAKKHKESLKVIQEYQRLNDLYREEHNGEDMNMSEILLHKVGGRTHATLYYSLIGHLRQGTIKPEQIQTRSNLKKYSQEK